MCGENAIKPCKSDAKKAGEYPQLREVIKKLQQ